MLEIGESDRGVNAFFLALQSGEDALAQEAVEQLAAMPAEAQAAVVDGCRALLNHPNADTRWWTVRALSEVSDPAGGELLAQALRDPDQAVRQCAALALRLQPHPAAIAPLAALLADRDPLLAGLATDALAAHGQAAVPVLLEQLQSGALGAKALAARALTKIGDPRAIPGLIAALDGDSALLEYWAAEGLERMGVGMAFFRPA